MFYITFYTTCTGKGIATYLRVGGHERSARPLVFLILHVASIFVKLRISNARAFAGNADLFKSQERAAYMLLRSAHDTRDACALHTLARI